MQKKNSFIRLTFARQGFAPSLEKEMKASTNQKERLKTIPFIKHRIVCRTSLFRGILVPDTLAGLLDCRVRTKCLYLVFRHTPATSACDITVPSEVIPFFLRELLIPSRILGGVLTVLKDCISTLMGNICHFTLYKSL